MAPVKSIIAASVLMAAQLVSGHAAITNAVGDAGGSGMALGIVSSTPRDGTRRNPFQQDATRFRGASAQTFGETVGAGANDLESGTSKIMAETGDSLPQVTAGGEVTMTLHQVNADGAGPYTCMINADGTGGNWENIQVTQNVDGNQRGRNRDGNSSDHPLVAAIPADQQCTGTVAGENNICLVRCQNPANAGPFGGVVPVQMAGAAGATPAAGGAGAVASPAAGNGAAGNGAINNGAINNGAAGAQAGNAQLQNGNAQLQNGNAQLQNGNAQTGNAQLQNGNAQAGNAQLQNGNAQAGNAQLQNGNAQAGNAQLQNGNAQAGNAQVEAGNAQAGNAQVETGRNGQNNNINNNKRRAIKFSA